MRVSLSMVFGSLLLVACQSREIDPDLLKGHWRLVRGFEYTELQVEDSLYYYVEEAGHYTGPIQLIGFEVKDSLLTWVEGDLTQNTFKIRRVDSILLLDNYEEYVRFEPKHELRSWRRGKDSLYREEFLLRLAEWKSSQE